MARNVRDSNADCTVTSRHRDQEVVVVSGRLCGWLQSARDVESDDGGVRIRQQTLLNQAGRIQFLLGVQTPPPFDRKPQRADQFVSVVVAFDEIILRTGLDSVDRQFHGIVAGEDHNRNFPGSSVNRLKCFEARAVGQMHIKDDQVEFCLAQSVDGRRNTIDMRQHVRAIH